MSEDFPKGRLEDPSPERFSSPVAGDDPAALPTQQPAGNSQPVGPALKDMAPKNPSLSAAILVPLPPLGFRMADITAASGQTVGITAGKISRAIAG